MIPQVYIFELGRSTIIVYDTLLSWAAIYTFIRDLDLKNL